MMMRLLTLILLFASSASAVVGGREVLPNESPAHFSVALVDDQARMVSSGVIVGKQWILTAAHNTISARTRIRFSTHAFSTAEDSRQIREVIAYPDQEVDAKLLRFDGGLPKGFVSAVLAQDNPASDELAWAAGFGISQLGSQPFAGTLRSAPFSVTKADSNYIVLSADPTQVHGVCSGDSGGPLLTSDKKTVLGILHGAISSSGDMCLGSALYTPVSTLFNWILTTTK